MSKPSGKGRASPIAQLGSSASLAPIGKALRPKDGVSEKSGFEGLNDLMDGWKREGETLDRERKAEECKERQPFAMAEIHSEYLEEATSEDKELIGRWTETLNILLTFGGLLSATITAFLLAVQAQIEPDPIDTTNKVLLLILQRLDNTTDISDMLGIPTAPTNAVRILAWWYASLSCSLASTFGALLSKQWVMHYESNPPWANSTEKQCQLREVRYQGLDTWKFHLILESLPVLIQVSLLLFAIGVADYLQPNTVLSIMVLAFIGAVGTFYIVTLIAGTFFPSCPFKSPVTHVLFRVAGTAGVWALAFIFIIAILVCSLLLVILRQIEDARELFGLIRALVTYCTNDRLGLKFQMDYGEYSLLATESVATAGILCSRLQRQLGANEPPIKDLEAAADVIMSFPIKIGAKTFRERETFELWCGPVISRLNGVPPLESAFLIEGDMLCYIIHHFPEALHAVKAAILDDDNLEALTEEAIHEHLAKILRQAWTQSVERGAAHLPVTSMRPTTIALYLRVQLVHWSFKAPDERLNGNLLLDELPYILEDGYLKDTLHTATADAVTVLSLCLATDDPLDALQLTALLRADPLEQLFQGLHRLSHYPTDQAPFKLISLAAGAVSAALEDKHVRARCSRQPSWKDGRLAATLLRLLELGRTWWYLEPEAWSEEAPGTTLVHHVQNILALLLNHHTSKGIPGLSPLFLERLDDVFATYAHPSSPAEVPPQVSTPALRILDYALILLKRHRSTRSSHQSLADSNSPSPASFLALLRKYPQTMRQLIHTAHHAPEDTIRRQIVLSIMVRGRDMLFSPAVFPASAHHEEILQVLAALESDLPHSLEPLPMESLSGFEEKWDAVEPLLVDLEQALLSTDGNLVRIEAEGRDDEKGQEGEEHSASGPLSEKATSSSRPGSEDAHGLPELEHTSIPAVLPTPDAAHGTPAETFEQASTLELGISPRQSDSARP